MNEGNTNAQAPVIAIDGPTASGKGTIALGVANALGWHSLDSGALYRLVALQAMARGIALDDAAAVSAAQSGRPPPQLNDP